MDDDIQYYTSKMKQCENFSLKSKNAKICYYTSQYHHGCHVDNLIESDPSCCWFSSAYAPLPQHIIVELNTAITVEKLGIYLHGDNNQNPQEIKFYVSDDGDTFDEVVYDTLEQRPGDFLWNVHRQHVKFVKYEVIENFGGSGAHTSQIYVYGFEQ